MRVIAGIAKGHCLKHPKGLATRPTADKIKGAIFSMLEAMLGEEGRVGTIGGRILDLYAGSGALGIEALSRGAVWADFVDSDRNACRTIQENLTHTRLADRAKVHCCPVRAILSGRQRSRLSGTYNLIFMDPPYADPHIGDTLLSLGRSNLLKPTGILIVGHFRRLELSDSYADLRLIRRRCHGDACLSFYRQMPTSKEEVT
ncbi:MAG: 16S rRNA (guanine(966)-N(2))-methyltransferase RsmD [Chloroflexi bacterium]|nr:16S rRNA (guanine(966)-N(2))-methyltransferase RsmD [Chloroflexota bacterium]MCL5074108.1 16S rRNA (guanine(966)-N(2))-methyltransferase RsmD [Chloroflexota bacterium]